MGNVLLTVILLSNLALLALLTFVFIRISREYQQTKELLASFFQPDKEGEATPFAQLVASSGDILASSLVARLKASFMGDKSGAVRGEAAVEGELALDMASAGNPIVGALIQQFPGLRKLAKKNPQLVDAVVNKFINQKFGGNLPAQPGSNHNSSQVKMTL